MLYGETFFGPTRHNTSCSDDKGSSGLANTNLMSQRKEKEEKIDRRRGGKTILRSGLKQGLDGKGPSDLTRSW